MEIDTIYICPISHEHCERLDKVNSVVGQEPRPICGVLKGSELFEEPCETALDEVEKHVDGLVNDEGAVGYFNLETPEDSPTVLELYHSNGKKQLVFKVDKGRKF
jgi:hypothetical protein